MRFANFDAITKVTGQTLFPKSIIPLIVRSLILVSIVLSISGLGFWYSGYSSDLDFILVIDASGSMLADDYEPNRLVAAKESAKDFVDLLNVETNVGVISFAGSSFITQELTNDKNTVKESINTIETIGVGGTAIGDSVVLASNVFKISGETDKGRSIILLTDGQSNVGISVEDSIEYAKLNGVVVNTLGIGTEEGGSFIDSDVILTLDSETLELLAKETGGKFYLINNKEELKEAYSDIISSTVTRIFFDAKFYLLLFALILLIAEWVLSNTRYKTII